MTSLNSGGRTPPVGIDSARGDSTISPSEEGLDTSVPLDSTSVSLRTTGESIALAEGMSVVGGLTTLKDDIFIDLVAR